LFGRSTVVIVACPDETAPWREQNRLEAAY
jgi:hypothetical protein